MAGCAYAQVVAALVRCAAPFVESMDVQTVTEPTPDVFDTSVVVESNERVAVAPVEIDADAAEPVEPPAKPRDEHGQFAKAGEKPVEEPAKKPRNDPQARIDQAIARQRDAERRADDAERRARDVEARATREPAKEPVKAAIKPKTDEFPSFAAWVEQHPDANESDDPLRDYNKAHYAHMREQERQQEADQKVTEQNEQTFKVKAAAFSERLDKAIEADKEVLSRINPRLMQVRPYGQLTKADKDLIRAIADPVERDRVAFECFLAEQWIDSDHAVPILEYLSDPKEFQRLATLPPNAVIRELAKREAGFTAASPKDSGPVVESKPASKAQPPIKPLGGAPRVPDDEGSEEEPVESFIRRENSKDRKAGRL